MRKILIILRLLAKILQTMGLWTLQHPQAMRGSESPMEPDGNGAHRERDLAAGRVWMDADGMIVRQEGEIICKVCKDFFGVA
jgi:hypothetical protein